MSNNNSASYFLSVIFPQILTAATLAVSLFIWQSDNADNDKKDAYSVYFDYLKARSECLNKKECKGLDELSIVTAERLLTLGGNDIGWKNTVKHIYKNESTYFTGVECQTLSGELVKFLDQSNLQLNCSNS
ncbi:hypothetical protein [Photobacterium leiognathi]|uniref:hypothetical protein n=1 Tax=Photobacterium leiognathi TaxID=553611 RepID=UPI002732D4EB|nr:hypothetical protein [Photobacterium leiognathi]